MCQCPLSILKIPFGAGLPTPPKPPTDGFQSSRALSVRCFHAREKETSGHTFRRGQETRAKLGGRFS